MIPAERHRAILSLLKNQEVISINELMEQLNVSHMTVRRDISRLENEGKVISVSGGVQLTKPLHIELSHDDNIQQCPDEKIAISHYAAEIAKDHKVIYLDAGTTSLEIAKRLSDRKELTIITNDFVITNYLMNHSECCIYHIGGKIDRNNKSCTGNSAAQALSRLNIDLAFVSTSSWNQRGISTPNEDKVLVKQTIIKVAKHNYLVSDSSKYGRVGAFHAVDLESFDAIITDSHFSIQIKEDLAKRNIEVLMV